MATTIKLKNGSGAPLAGDLVQGEPALDLTNKRLYTEDSGGNVIEVGTNPGTDVTFADNRKAIFGTGSDLEIYHNATDSVIADVGTGNLKILADGLRINNADSSKSYITGVNGSYVNLYYNGAQKLTTTSTGIDVTGGVNIDDDNNYSFGNGTAYIQGSGAANRLKFITNASEAMRIDSSGDLLLGGTISYTSFLSSAAGNLQVNGGIIGEPGSGNPFQIANYRGSPIAFLTSGNVERMRIDGSGNVGIGTTSPIAASNYANLTLNGSSGGNLHFADDDVKVATIASSVNDLYVQCGSQTIFRNGGFTGGDESMRIDSSGNVGIGTSSPAYPLQVNGKSYALQNVNANGSAAAPSYAFGNDEDCGMYRAAVNTVGFSTAGTEAMRIDSSGNLLVGTTSTSAVIGGTVDGQYLGSSGTRYSSDNGTGGKNHNIFYNANGQVGSISTSGSSTTFSTSSDQRLKENIVDAPAGNIDAIQVRSFDWKADGSHQTYGMVAQELVEVAPEAVTQGETEDEMWGVDYSKLVPMMIKEIQDLKAEVAALKGA